jgi:hypothetical protein
MSVNKITKKLESRRVKRMTPRSGIDQRKWWERGDAARREDEQNGDVSAFATADELLDGLDLYYYFADELAGLSKSQQAAALEAAEDGYVEGRAGGYGQPSWLSASAGGGR